jgi:hypothetical protein
MLSFHAPVNTTIDTGDTGFVAVILRGGVRLAALFVAAAAMGQSTLASSPCKADFSPSVSPRLAIVMNLGLGKSGKFVFI